MRKNETDNEKVRYSVSKSWGIISIHGHMRYTGTSEQEGRKGKVGLCCRGHECDNEKSILKSLLDKGTGLKAGGFQEVTLVADFFR